LTHFGDYVIFISLKMDFYQLLSSGGNHGKGKGRQEGYQKEAYQIDQGEAEGEAGQEKR
jgi:hypothetical protein